MSKKVLITASVLMIGLAVGVLGRSWPSSEGDCHHDDDGADTRSRISAGDDAGISQNTCPVRGEPIDFRVSTEHDGRKIFFCCEDCIEKFNEDPSRYLAKLDQNPESEVEYSAHSGHSH